MTVKISNIVKKLKEDGAEKVHISTEGSKEYTILVSAMDPKKYYMIRSYVFMNFKDKIDMYCEVTNPLNYHKYLNSVKTVEYKQ